MTVTWAAAQQLPDAELLRLRSEIADQCVRVVAMSEEDRHRVGPKGEASPWEAGAMSAVFAQALDREVRRRGLEDGPGLR